MSESKHTPELTDQEIENNHEALRRRLAKAPDMRTEKANEHVKDIAIVNEITGESWQPGPYESFLSGWDDAMQITHESLIKEMETVRSEYDDLVCERFAAEKLLPDLLAALKRAVELYGKPGGPWNVPSDPGSWLMQARAAIAAAEAVR